MTQQTFNHLYFNQPQVIAKMLWYQAQQGRVLDCSTGLDDRSYGKGFSWMKTSEGTKFWGNIMNGVLVGVDLIPSFKLGNPISLMHKGKPKKFIFLSWELSTYSVLVMTERAYSLLMMRVPSEDNVQEITKMPIANIIW